MCVVVFLFYAFLFFFFFYDDVIRQTAVSVADIIRSARDFRVGGKIIITK